MMQIDIKDGVHHYTRWILRWRIRSRRKALGFCAILCAAVKRAGLAVGVLGLGIAGSGLGR